jgi:hypothetical protein
MIANLKTYRHKTVSTRNGWHVEIVDKTLALAARGVLPVWRTTPTVTLFRDSGIPSAMAALEEAKLRFAMRLQTVDVNHPLVGRIPPSQIIRGRGAGTQQRPKTKVQRLGTLLPSTPRPRLTPPNFTSVRNILYCHLLLNSVNYSVISNAISSSIILVESIISVTK